MRARAAVGTVAALGAATAAYAGVRRWFLRWGTSAGEQAGRLPGDAVLPGASLVTTRAVTIDAPPEEVWPWLVQMGQDRAGFYSYDHLENLFGLQIHNIRRVVPDWQDLEVGDQLRAAPERFGPEAGFTVVQLDPGRSLVTAMGDPARVLPLVEAGALADGGTWAFVLRPEDGGRTRLLVRMRAGFALPPVAAWLVARLLEPVHFVMERRQLLTLRALAAARLAPAEAPRLAPVSPASASSG